MSEAPTASICSARSLTLEPAPDDRYQEVMRLFLGGKAPATIEAYRRDLTDFCRSMGSDSVEMVASGFLSLDFGRAHAVVLAYRSDLLDRGLSPATVNRRLAALRSLVQIGRMIGAVQWSLEIPNVRASSYRDTRGPGVRGFLRLLRANDRKSGPKPARDRAILRLLYDLALRRGEVASLDLDDLDLETKRIRVTGKGEREATTLSLPDPTADALARWVELRGDTPGPLFTNFDRAGKTGRLTGTSIYRLVRRLGESEGIRARPHGLRHTAITEACKVAESAGVHLEEVLDFSRHSDVKTLMIYRDRERNVQGTLAALVAGTAARLEEDDVGG